MKCPQRRNHSWDKPEYREKLRTVKLGSRNPMWKGEKVGKLSLHEWVKSRKEKPSVCERCKKNSSYDLSNKTGSYKRDLDDWEWLCRRCHMEDDGRINRRGKDGKFVNKMSYLR